MNMGMFIAPLVGGALIGASASMVLLVHGRVAGVSGIFGAALKVGNAWSGEFRVPFLLGLALTGLAFRFVAPGVFDAPATSVPIVMVIASGLLVGFGTQMSGGCTSGHGVCGISRLSVRSILATMTFMAAGFVTVFVVRHLLGGHS